MTQIAAAHPDALVQVGGDPTRLLERAEPDIVLNAIVGFAGIRATLWALDHGVTLALANKESLVAGGVLAHAAQTRGGGLLIPVDSEHSAIYQCLEGRDLGDGRLARPDRLGRAVPGTHPRRADDGDRRGGARAPDLEHGTEDHGRLRHPRQQGSRADRGALALRHRVRPRSRWSSTRRPSCTALVRFRDGAALAHVGYPDMRVPISFALTYPERAGTPVPPLDLAAGLTLSFEAPDLEAFPLLRARARGGGGRRHVSVRLQRGERGRGRGLPRGPDRLPRDRRDRGGDARAGGRRAGLDLDELIAADAEARSIAERRLVAA